MARRPRPPLLMLAVYLAIVVGGLAVGIACHWPWG